MSLKSVDEQVALLMQGTEYGDESLKQAMANELRSRLNEAQREARPLRVYSGFDPRTSDLHIGHTVPIRKLRQFQELGHEVVFLIGRFTSLVGDPSDQDKARAQISLEQATINAETYAEQAFKILDPERTRIEYNDLWLSKLSFADLIGLASHFTVQQFLSRENFRKRFEAEEAIYVHEFFYSLMQAYDAFHLRTDVQVGGTDQLFNIITAGRKLMEALGAKPNIGVILGILPGTDGVVKMSKSLGNHIPLNSSPEDMYGKVMSIPDEAMGSYFRLVTRWDPSQIEALESGLASGAENPRDVKMKLAREIVAISYGEEAAEAAEAAFVRVFQQGKKPQEIDDFKLELPADLVGVIVATGLVNSKSEARRLIRQGGVRLGDIPVEDIHHPLTIDAPTILQVGKRRFVRLIP